MMELLVKKL